MATPPPGGETGYYKTIDWTRFIILLFFFLKKSFLANIYLVTECIILDFRSNQCFAVFFLNSSIIFGIFSFPQLFAMVFAMCLFRGIQ